MITKGVIINKIDETKCSVRIPTFETVGNSSNLMNSDSVYEATICYTPGILNSYLPGDVVYLGFEDNDYGKIIILGKLYQGSDTNPISFAKLDKLYVDKSTEISGNLKVNGVDLSVINEHTQAISSIMSSNAMTSENDFGDWNIKTTKQGLVLNFYRKRGIEE